jgi:hypothetical protein
MRAALILSRRAQDLFKSPIGSLIDGRMTPGTFPGSGGVDWQPECSALTRM